MSAFNGNYSGGTFLSNLVSRPEFLQYTAEGIFEQSKWVQSGIVQRNAALDARAGGTRVRVPFFDPIAPTESQILSNSTWGGGGGYLVPANVTADEQIMTLLHRGFAYAADDLSKLGSGADPLAHVRNQLTAAINKLKTATSGSPTAWSVRRHLRRWRPWPQPTGQDYCRRSRQHGRGQLPERRQRRWHQGEVG
jgi:hypothetical protein